MDDNIYKKKQEWLDAVMASDLSPATKVFAYGIFKHMYGVKETAYPGTKSLEETTGLSKSKFPQYRQALVEAGFLDAEVEKGRVYTYSLSYMYPEGTGTCTQKVQHMYPEGTTHVPRRYTNTTSNTTKKTSSKTSREESSDPLVADAPVVSSSSNNLEVKVREGEVVLETEEKSVSTLPNLEVRRAFVSGMERFIVRDMCDVFKIDEYESIISNIENGTISTMGNFRENVFVFLRTKGYNLMDEGW